MEGDTVRLFVAILPTEPVRRALARLMVGPDEVKWERPEQLHLTLRFIGNVALEDEPKITTALRRVTVRPFFLETAGVGGFPPRGHPQVLWAGVGRGHPLLHQLRQQVDDFLLTTQVPFELRAFQPHFTLGRTGAATPVSITHWLKRHRDFLGPVWPVAAFHLVASRLTPAGAVHHVVESFPLQ
jgi:2'-5' RNA ligase